MQRLLRDLDLIQRLHVVQADYEKSLALIAALKAGEVTLDQVTLVANGWNISELPAVDDQPPEVPVEVGCDPNAKTYTRLCNSPESEPSSQLPDSL